MPPRARIYLHCVVGTGLFLLWDGLSQFAAADLPQFIAYLALALLSATWRFQIPGIPVTFSTTFAFILIGIANFSLGEALLMGCGATLVQCLWKPPYKLSGRKMFFNIAGVAIGIRVAYNPMHVPLAGGPHYAAWMLSLAAALYFLLNTALVSGMIALLEQEAFGPVWRRLAKYSIAFYVVGGLIASLVIVANRLWGGQIALFVLPLLFVTYRLYRSYLRRRGIALAS